MAAFQSRHSSLRASEVRSPGPVLITRGLVEVDFWWRHTVPRRAAGFQHLMPTEEPSPGPQCSPGTTVVRTQGPGAGDLGQPRQPQGTPRGEAALAPGNQVHCRRARPSFDVKGRPSSRRRIWAKQCPFCYSRGKGWGEVTFLSLVKCLRTLPTSPSSGCV